MLAHCCVARLLLHGATMHAQVAPTTCRALSAALSFGRPAPAAVAPAAVAGAVAAVPLAGVVEAIAVVGVAGGAVVAVVAIAARVGHIGARAVAYARNGRAAASRQGTGRTMELAYKQLMRLRIASDSTERHGQACTNAAATPSPILGCIGIVV